MTNPQRSEAGRGDGATAVAWLSTTPDSGCVAGMCASDCLVVARILLSAVGWPRDGVAALSSSPSIGGRLEAVAEDVPAVGAWLAARLAAVYADTAASGDGICNASGDGDLLVASRFVRSLVLPGDEMAPPNACGQTPATEAAMLRDAARLVQDHLELRDRFEHAVAEARLEAMRELAYGAGHEINNPLANIATRAQSLLLEEADPERRRRLSTIVDQAFRARDMIGGLMLFARPPKPRREPADLGRILDAVIESVRGQTSARSVRLEYSPSPSPECVLVDAVQVEEAIRVIVVNAIEAVTTGGRVVLEVACRSREGNAGCEVIVTDDGLGMTPEVARRAFDPFFSGREAGRGAGLGLSKAWRLLESNGGAVLVDSRPGQGTRVTIRLPEASPPTPVSAESGGARRQSQRISP